MSETPEDKTEEQTTEEQQPNEKPKIGKLADVALGVRAELAVRILQADGSADDVIKELAGALDKEIEFKRISDPEDDEEIIDAEITDKGEISEEILEARLEQLHEDFNRGIVVIEEDKTIDDYQSDINEGKIADAESWDEIEERLLLDKSSLLKKAAKMQGGGQLIGVYSNGDLCIRDRGVEPVIITFDDEGDVITITTDTPDRDVILQEVGKDARRLGNYTQIRDAVHEAGYILPERPEQPIDYDRDNKKGVVAASEAVTETFFIEGNENWRTAIMECGDLDGENTVPINVIHYNPHKKDTTVGMATTADNNMHFGAVRILRG